MEEARKPSNSEPYTVCNEACFPGVKKPGHEPNIHLNLVKNVQGYTFTPYTSLYSNAFFCGLFKNDISMSTMLQAGR
jgi:hypothetical protein